VFGTSDVAVAVTGAGDGGRAVGRDQKAFFGITTLSVFGTFDVVVAVVLSVEAGGGARAVGRVQKDFFGFSAAFCADDTASMGEGVDDGARPRELGCAQEAVFELEASAAFGAGDSVVCSFPVGRAHEGVFGLATDSIAADSAALLATDRTQEGCLAPEDAVDDAGDLGNQAGSFVSSVGSASLFVVGRTQEGFCCLAVGEVVDATGEVDNHAGCVVVVVVAAAAAAAAAWSFATCRTQDGLTAGDVCDAAGDSVVSTGAFSVAPGRIHGVFLTAAGEVVDATGGDVRKNGDLNSTGLLADLTVKGDFSFSCRIFDCDSLFPELDAFGGDRLEVCCS
jgi:hypothetical protein